ncbi:hypothetical protein [Leptolyngbya sp. FACHB-261]|uniref:hypothetical protein n=1 Tax=Leptolyngbya sp. FACHB-261 TaxID=2692806 RepID=UPI001683C77B|nr:hypothetical protein [Leptolyngbya sp. FACHB-261]MBD2102023.1 hypothetical protein [Leptolyngbya sp. FACHB-261]
MFKVNTADYDFANPNALYVAKQNLEYWVVQYMSEDSAGVGYGSDLRTAMINAECDAFVQYLATVNF